MIESIVPRTFQEDDLSLLEEFLDCSSVAAWHDDSDVMSVYGIDYLIGAASRGALLSSGFSFDTASKLKALGLVDF